MLFYCPAMSLSDTMPFEGINHLCVRQTPWLRATSRMNDDATRKKKECVRALYLVPQMRQKQLFLLAHMTKHPFLFWSSREGEGIQLTCSISPGAFNVESKSRSLLHTSSYEGIPPSSLLPTIRVLGAATTSGATDDNVPPLLDGGQMSAVCTWFREPMPRTGTPGEGSSPGRSTMTLSRNND